jgi:hypothetical protein
VPRPASPTPDPSAFRLRDSAGGGLLNRLVGERASQRSYRLAGGIPNRPPGPSWIHTADPTRNDGENRFRNASPCLLTDRLGNRSRNGSRSCPWEVNLDNPDRYKADLLRYLERFWLFSDAGPRLRSTLAEALLESQVAGRRRLARRPVRVASAASYRGMTTFRVA